MRIPMPILIAASAVTLGSLLTGNCARAQDEFETQRREMHNRQRRVILNNDGCDCLYFPKSQEITPENFLELRTTALAGTHVDTVFYCTISSGFSNFTHNTQVGNILDKSFDPNARDHNITRQLIDQGNDCLKLVVDFCHANDMECFWSMRMNDTHDGAHRPDAPYPLFPPLKEQHPEWLVGEYGKKPRYSSWTSVDYTVPEIRDLAFRYIEEVCQNYDVDGVELDFFRHMNFFKSTANGNPASQEELDMMTDLMRRVREMTEREGRKRGRPIMIAVRVVDSVDYSRLVGIDLEKWLAEGLVDILIATCYFQLNPWEYLVDLGHKYGVKVYPGLSETRVRGEIPPLRRHSQESYRARAARVWQSGADGVYLFNFFNPKAPMLSELGDPKLLSRLDKLYFATVRNGNPDNYVPDGKRFQNVPIVTPENAATVEPGRDTKITLQIGDDFAAQKAAGLAPEVTARVVAMGSDHMGVAVNGHALTCTGQDGAWSLYSMEPEWLKPGANEFVFSTGEKQAAPGQDAWNVEWTAEKVPAAPWYHDPYKKDVTVADLRDGALLVADRGDGGGEYLYFYYPWAASTELANVVEAEAKVVSGWNTIIINDGKSTERLSLYPDRVELYNGKLRHVMDTTDRFHTYRVSVKGADIKVWVDGELVIDGTGKFTAPGEGGRNTVQFGAANSPEKGEALWKAVRFSTPAAAVYDLAVSVKYPKPE